jgi:hypothetical protein
MNNGVVVEEALACPRELTPINTVRMLGTMANIPLLLSAGKTYEVPAEVCSPALLALTELKSMREAVVKTRNAHRSLPSGHPLAYRRLSDSDLYAFGLSYLVLTKRIKIKASEFHKEDLDFVIDLEYINQALEQHVMAARFKTEHVVDLCAAISDPRMHLGPGGQFKYYQLSQLLGFGSFELACQIIRKLIELHGPDPLPYDGGEVKKLLQKATGGQVPYGGHPVQVLGSRVLHGILTAPLDGLGINLLNEHLKNRNTRLARDAEVVRQRLHLLIDGWLGKVLGADWTPDKYDPELFADPSEAED